MINRDRNIRDASKQNPIFFRGLCKAGSCGSQAILIQRLSGGLVNWKCQKCGRYRNLQEDDFFNSTDFSFACNECSQELIRDKENKNYILKCNQCG